MARDEPLMIVDGEGVVVRWSPAAERLLGCPAAKALGRPATALVPRSALRSGQAVPADLRVRPVLRRDGSVAWAVRRAPAGERAARVLSAVREHVGHCLDVEHTCQELVDTLVPDFADIAVVEVVDAVMRGEDPPPGPLARDVPLRRAAYRAGDGFTPARVPRVGDVGVMPFPTPFTQTLTDLRPRLLDLDPGAPWLEAAPDRAEAIRASGARTLITAPLTLRGTVLGLVSLYRTGASEPYDEQDVGLAVEIAAHAALCVDNARRYTREHTIAMIVQRHLLPQRPTVQTSVETAHLQILGGAGGGGWFDTFALSGARTALVIGDVRGHGIHTAATMGQLRTAIHSLAALDLEPDELLARLNDAATHLAEERAALPPGDAAHPEELSAGCVYAVYDPLTRIVTVARADHPAPLVVDPGGAAWVPDLPEGPPLGSAEGPPFAAATAELAEGSLLAFHTPALLPGHPGALRQVLGDPDRPLQDLCDDVAYRMRDDTCSADAILLLARTRAFPADRVAGWDLEDGPTAPATAREHVRRRLAGWGVAVDTAFATELTVSELVTNAVRYGSPPVRLRVILDRTLTCEVHDASGTAPRMRHARTVDEGGRGLYIVARLAQNWGTRYTPDGKSVWAELAL